MQTARTGILLLILLIAGGCAVNPVTGKNELSLISESAEIAMGAEQYVPSQQAQGGQFVTDPALLAYVQGVGRRVAAASDRDLPYEFVVLNNGVPNAWALPGGKIAINRGLLVELDNEAELAAVLGHEAVHAAAKHGANAVQRGMILQGLVTATAIGAAVTESDYSNYVVGGAQLGAQLVSQKYGRSAELESDYYGTLYMTAAGYDPAASVSLQETFVRLSGGRETGFVDGLFASHPPSEARVAANRATVEQLGNPGGEIGREQYQQAIAFLKKNSQAYKNFSRAETTYAEGDYNKALSTLTTALQMVPSEPRFHGLMGNIRYRQQRYDDAEAAYARAIELDSNYFEYHLGRGLVLSKKGDRARAKQSLERSNALLPTAVANQELGQLSLASGDRQAAKQYFNTAMSAGGGLGRQATTSFLQLDIPDHPTRYIEIAPRLTDRGHLLAAVKNLTPLPLSSVQLRFTATVRGETQSVLVDLPLAASETRDAISGWQFGAEDGLTNVDVSVMSIRL